MVRTVTIDSELMLNIMKVGNVSGYLSQVRCITGLPDDSRIVASRLNDRGELELSIESKEFDSSGRASVTYNEVIQSNEAWETSNEPA